MTFGVFDEINDIVLFSREHYRRDTNQWTILTVWPQTWSVNPYGVLLCVFIALCFHVLSLITDVFPCYISALRVIHSPRNMTQSTEKVWK